MTESAGGESAGGMRTARRAGGDTLRHASEHASCIYINTNTQTHREKHRDTHVHIAEHTGCGIPARFVVARLDSI